jgi:hypothetical protein
VFGYMQAHASRRLKLGWCRDDSFGGTDGKGAPSEPSELETDTDGRIDGAAMEKPVRQSIIDLRVHEPGVGVEFRAKFPIHSERNGVLGAATSGERGGCAIDDAKAVLKVVIPPSHPIWR